MRRRKRQGLRDLTDVTPTASGQDMSSVTDAGLCRTTDELRFRFSEEGCADPGLLSEGLTVAGEAMHRGLDITITSSQQAAAAITYAGGVAELGDGEGKGVAVILAAYLAVLAGQKVHVVALDDYLAARDFERAQAVLGLLGVTTRLISDAGLLGERRVEYGEVTYGSYTRFVGDYLSDSLARHPADLVQDTREFALVDEADTILADHARQPVRVLEAAAQGGPVVAQCLVRDYFRSYGTIAGLTATGMPAGAQLQYLYDLSVTPVPATAQMARTDYSDRLYGSTDYALAVIAETAIDRHICGQPVLIRVRSASECEQISGLLSGRGLVHAVLGSSEDPEAARIMAEAGRMSAITVMVGAAGRGYGVPLGGDLSYAAVAEVRSRPGSRSADSPAELSRELRQARDAAQPMVSANRDRVVAAGGLMVLGVGRAESGRADDWLRGLAGQRGTPGESLFCSSNADHALYMPRRGPFRSGKLDSRPLVGNGPLRSRAIQMYTSERYRSAEKWSLTVVQEMAVFDDVIEGQHQEAHAIRQRLLEFEGADEIITWLSSGTDSALYSAQTLRDAYAERVEDPGAAGMHELLRSAALSTFDLEWAQHVARLREMYPKVPDGRKRATAKVAESFQQAADDGLAKLVADVKVTR